MGTTTSGRCESTHTDAELSTGVRQGFEPHPGPAEARHRETVKPEVEIFLDARWIQDGNSHVHEGLLGLEGDRRRVGGVVVADDH